MGNCCGRSARRENQRCKKEKKDDLASSNNEQEEIDSVQRLLPVEQTRKTVSIDTATIVIVPTTFVACISKSEEGENDVRREDGEPVTQGARHDGVPCLTNVPHEEGRCNVYTKKVYSREFLLQFEKRPVCQKKPDILLLNLSCLKKCDGAQVNSSSRLRTQTSHDPVRNNKPKTTIHYKLSSQKVKLNVASNAWVPTALKTAKDATTTDEVYKQVRSILNKITPENMGSLTESLKTLPINNIESLEKTVDLVFEKAIEEQCFAPVYAYLCTQMKDVRVNSRQYGKFDTFKSLLINKCHELFHKDNTQELNSPEVATCETRNMELRRSSVANCRFIGELFLRDFIPSNVMLICAKKLIDRRTDESLECVCKLLVTVGKEMEKSHNLDEIFNRIQTLIAGNKANFTSRIRFMVLDLYDLRRSKWEPSVKF